MPDLGATTDSAPPAQGAYGIAHGAVQQVVVSEGDVDARTGMGKVHAVTGAAFPEAETSNHPEW